jgi:hypothetical protein
MKPAGHSKPVARRVAACLIAAWMGGAGAQPVVYKWVDAAGVTHYASQPPPGATATVVPLPPPAPVASAASAGVVEMPRPRPAPPPLPAPAAARDDASAAGRLRDCARARQQQDSVTRGGPVFRYDESGRRVYLEDRARDAEIARLAATAARLCSGLPESQQAAAEQAADAEAAAAARCLAAQEALRELESNARTVTQDLERARDTVRQRCVNAP